MILGSSLKEKVTISIVDSDGREQAWISTRSKLSRFESKDEKIKVLTNLNNVKVGNIIPHLSWCAL